MTRVPLTGAGGAGFTGAYDAFAASIVHAYEPARRVLSTYTGSLVRLRRASDNAERNFTYLANGNLDVAAIAAWAGGASYVVTVYDQGGFADNVTMAVAANQPLYVANARNGHAGMLHDGTSDHLEGAFTTGGALSQPFGIYAVSQLDNSIIADGDYHYLATDDTAAVSVLYKNNSDKWAIYSGALLAGNPADANWKIWSTLFNGASSQFWLNGVSEAAGNAGAVNSDGLTVGARFDGTANFWKGYIVSMIICDPSLSDAQRVAMQVQMNSYWGVF